MGGSSLADNAYALLRAAIIEHRLVAGATVLEKDLGATLRVSRTPIREALTRLELEGYLERDDSQRLVVHPVSRREIVETFLVRELLEGHAAQLAADRISRAETTQLDELVAADRRALRRHRADERALINDEIHRLIMEASRNTMLTAFVDNLKSRVHGLSSFAVGSVDDQRQFSDDHAAMAQMLRDGDGEAASALVRAHLRHARDLLIRGLDSDGNLSADSPAALAAPIMGRFTGTALA